MRRALSFIAGTAIVLGALAGPAASAASAASATHAAPAIFIPKAVSVATCLAGGGVPDYAYDICEGGLFDGSSLGPVPFGVHADPGLSLSL